MKVGRLIDELKDFRRDAEVFIAEYQTYGSDFAYSLSEVNVCHVNPFHGDSMIPCVAIVLGSQRGTVIGEDYDEDFDELDDLYSYDEDEDEDEDED